MNNNRHFGVSRDLREKTRKYRRRLANSRFWWLSLDRVVDIVAMIGVIVALWFMVYA